jgi:3-hydroxybutyryl-CoA dehydrogenase
VRQRKLRPSHAIGCFLHFEASLAEPGGEDGTGRKAVIYEKSPRHWEIFARLRPFRAIECLFVATDPSPLSQPTLDLRPRHTVAVLGAGTMGRGIAQVAATHGHFTYLFDSVAGKAAQAIDATGAELQKLVDKGRISSDSSTRALGCMRAAGQLRDACALASVVIEAAPEDMTLKVEILREAMGHCPIHTILASNTSSLSITELGARLGAPERTLGLHFFNPPPVMELLEVVKGMRTSHEVIDRAVSFARDLDKTPIVVRDTPGFASSRLGVILGAEAIRMLESGVAAARDIDRAMELGYRHPMGPLKLTDLVGLDVRLSILEYLHKEIGEQFRPPQLLRAMVRAGKLGKKTGEGFYVWKDGVAE